MAEMSWSANDLSLSGRMYGDCVEGLQQLASHVTPLEPAAYGTLVANAARGAEPATSDANRRVITAMASATRQVAEGLEDTARRYADVEQENVAPIRRLVSELRALGDGSNNEEFRDIG